MNLIERLGGYERAKAFLNAASYTMDELIKMQRSGLRTQHVEKALLEYRRQHNIFEPDDYIIHDGELKVFAMWSNAIGGCAYIGYAYAEDGEMAQKDEFRHATDEEMKAGKRLEVNDGY